MLLRSPTSRRLALLAVIILVPGIGVADHASGSDATFAALYLLPVVFATWTYGLRAGLLVSFSCTASGAVADYSLPWRSFGYVPIPAWNEASRLFIYVFSAWSLAKLQAALDARNKLIDELGTALREIRTLRGLLPICAWCKRIRDDKAADEWKLLEQYLREHSEADFTHGICPDCAAKVVQDLKET